MSELGYRALHESGLAYCITSIFGASLANPRRMTFQVELSEPLPPEPAWNVQAFGDTLEEAALRALSCWVSREIMAARLAQANADAAAPQA